MLMSNYKHPEIKASETVTFRLTLWERRLLDHLADVEQKSLTGLVKYLLLEHAGRLGIDELPEPKPKRRPGRPKMARPAPEPPPAPIVPEAEDVPSPPVAEEDHSDEMFFGDLVERFRMHFAGRAAGTRG